MQGHVCRARELDVGCDERDEGDEERFFRCSMDGGGGFWLVGRMIVISNTIVLSALDAFLADSFIFLEERRRRVSSCRGGLWCGFFVCREGDGCCVFWTVREGEVVEYVGWAWGLGVGN